MNLRSLKLRLTAGTLFLLFLILHSCAGNPTNTPEGIAQGFLQALDRRDFTQAASLAEGAAKAPLLTFRDMAAQMTKDEQDKAFPRYAGLVLDSTELQGDHAVVLWSDSDGMAGQLELARIDGLWKVLSRFSLD